MMSADIDRRDVGRSHREETDRRIYFGWWVVLASVLGLMVGDATVMTFSFGVFLNPIANDFGFSRGEVSFAFTLHVACLAISTPVVGALIDRKGSRIVLLWGIILFGAGVAALSAIGPSRLQLYLAFGLLGCIAATVTPVPYSRALCSWFDRRRGLALGISLAGVGLGAAILPQIAQALVMRAGWRRAYIGLGMISVLVAMPVIYALFRERRAGERGDDRVTASRPGDSRTHTGFSLSQAVRSRPFWLLFLIFGLSAAAVSGTALHIVPLLSDVGLPPVQAARVAGTLGLALIAGRVLSGHLMDRFFAPYVTTVFFLLSGAGMCLLSGHVTPFTAVLGAVLVGCGIGAELDVLSYLSSRYFGLQSFAQISACLFLGYVIGTSVGPAAMGVTFDRTGSYHTALLAFAALMVASSAVLCILGPYPTFTSTAQTGYET
jgi:MFS family permease